MALHITAYSNEKLNIEDFFIIETILHYNKDYLVH